MSVNGKAAVSQLWRYPVKSMAGERLRRARVTPTGLEGDRLYAFQDGAANRAGKPLTGRQRRELLAHRAVYREGRVTVTTPAGADLDAEDPALLAELDAAGLHRGAGENFDLSHLLLVNQASIDRLAASFGAALDERRFRGNVYLTGPASDAEYGWLGRRLRLGTALLEGSQMCERCVMITFDPDDLEADPRLLRVLAEERETLLGIYCRVVEPGEVAVGDALEVL